MKEEHISGVCRTSFPPVLALWGLRDRADGPVMRPICLFRGRRFLPKLNLLRWPPRGLMQHMNVWSCLAIDRRDGLKSLWQTNTARSDVTAVIKVFGGERITTFILDGYLS